MTNATNETIFERKRTWLIEKLRENSEDIRKCKKYIVIVVNFIPDWKLEYIVEFLKFNKNLEAFKQFSLFSSFCMYSGSQIPLIIENIEFLKSLKDKLSGIDYIDHRKYLEDYCISLVKDKDKLELEEYLKNADYA